MNLKKNYFTILLLTALFIFSSCSDDNSDVNLTQKTKQKARALFKKYGWSIVDTKEIDNKGFKKTKHRYLGIKILKNLKTL